MVVFPQTAQFHGMLMFYSRHVAIWIWCGWLLAASDQSGVSEMAQHHNSEPSLQPDSSFVSSVASMARHTVHRDVTSICWQLVHFVNEVCHKRVVHFQPSKHPEAYLLFYCLTTSKIISGRLPTCDSAYSLRLYNAASLGNQAVSTMTVSHSVTLSWHWAN